MALSRPVGTKIQRERFQRPLHPTHKSAQEAIVKAMSDTPPAPVSRSAAPPMSSSAPQVAPSSDKAADKAA